MACNSLSSVSMQLERASARLAKWREDNPEKYAMQLEQKKRSLPRAIPRRKIQRAHDHLAQRW